MSPKSGHGVAALPEYLAPLREVLLVQCETSQATRAAALADRPGGGLVISPDRGGLIPVYSMAHHLLSRGNFKRPVLLDARRYAGTGRSLAEAPFDQDWIRRQRDLGLTILPDSGYVAENNKSGVLSILTRTAEIGNAVAVLPLHISWLQVESAFETLVAGIQETMVPVALALEHRDDPAAAPGVIKNLIRLWESGLPIINLCFDISALGALCYGAWAAAVGTTTGLRHIYPLPSEKSKGGGHPAQVAAVVKQCLAYRSISTIVAAAQFDEGSSLWHCDCTTCLSRPLNWLGTVQPQRAQEMCAFSHSLETLLDLRDELASALTVTQMRESWRAKITNAQFRHEEVHSELNEWKPPKAFGCWLKATAPTALRKQTR